jgi:hypothetical protein
MEWENFWLYGARTFLKKQGNVNRCLSNLKKAFVIYKEDHDRSRWPIFIERIREDKDFKTVLNDAHFKEALLSASFLESNYEWILGDINMWAYSSRSFHSLGNPILKKERPFLATMMDQGKRMVNSFAVNLVLSKLSISAN